MEIKNLSANPGNPRRITDKKLSQLKKTLEEFGDLGGFVFNRRSQQLVGGHQRAKLFSQDAPIHIERTYDTHTRTGTVAEGYVILKGERFKYREVDWDDLREKAANIAANKGAGEWDDEKLGEWFKDLDMLGFDLDLTMFDETERIDFLEIAAPGNTDEDDVPEVEQNIHNVQRGQIWQLGNHRIMCGDSTSIEDVERLMNGEKADMVFTDPPYGISLDTSNRKTSGKVTNSDGKTIRSDLKVNNFKPIIGDNQEFDPTLLLSIPCKEMFIWGANNFTRLLPRGGWVCWDRKLNESADKSLSSDFELCWSRDIHKFAMCRITWHGVFGHTPDDGHKKCHPSQKPVKLAEWFFERWSKESKLIIDLFLGSGSTLIACEKTNRKCYGMEIDPHYCSVIIERWQNYTGQKAKLL